MAMTDLEQDIASMFIGSTDAYHFNQVIEEFSYGAQTELNDIVFNSFEDYLQYKNEYSGSNYFDFNGELFYQIKNLAVNHLYKEGYQELSDFLEEKLNIHYNYSASSFDYSTETKEEFEAILKKEFPNSIEGYRHDIFNDEYLTYVVESMEIDIDKFPVEELEE